ncbi:MAG: cysteine--tRNA ligase [Candidatus Andersenbacteria bacterium CG10_big_fil_rev_8_21_14_0_10_54_11]|uniref:Cysteine--tRNA ligase n=1 Tax=Candidatus Andersenbacteria bacterium CG10_big_fil_rev_8_21_14_0_10_54_11 TaxID=1974485 RepID=A0A2M6WYP1_9BACT|nr:MAG: cysteine--tRNA ligase [Candidatus Andersenbacteria bacterium CG10_big_fil_rev_8_21_14_0_10_54_11]
MALQFYNSLTKKIEPFVPQDASQVRVYHCGPTVYKRPHLGNMRRYLFADFLHRTLVFFGYTVREITNITDVGHLTQDDLDAGEDKLEREAREQQLTPQRIAAQVTEQYFADAAALNILPSNEYPRATAHIPAMQALITRLLARGHAYQTASGVYFDVTSFAEYGKLSGNTLNHVAAGARVAVREEKHHPADFALWKTKDLQHVQQWDSPWGRGYPGWHIECSAMAQAYLGETLDIHTGGEDNKFPHHENEIAQSESATGKPLALFWLHNAHLRTGGVKVAKRDGKNLTVSTLRVRGYSPLSFRLLVFASHYRSPVDFSWKAMDQAAANLATFSSLLQRLQEVLPFSPEYSFADKEGAEVLDHFSAALADDLNTPSALAVVLQYVHTLNIRLAEGALPAASAGTVWSVLLRLDSVLGVIESLLPAAGPPPNIAALAKRREAARIAGDFVRSDELRDQLTEAGWRIEDTSAGPRLIRL